MTDDEMIERIAQATWTADDKRRFGIAPDDVRKESVTDFIESVRAAGFEVIKQNELTVLRLSAEEPDYFDQCKEAEEECARLKEHVMRLTRKINGYEQECYEVDQVLGRALGCPHCPDENGDEDKEAPICTGESTPASLAVEAAKRICPPGWVCVDPEGEMIEEGIIAADDSACIVKNHFGAPFIANTEEVITSYLRAVRDSKESRK